MQLVFPLPINTRDTQTHYSKLKLPRRPAVGSAAAEPAGADAGRGGAQAPTGAVGQSPTTKGGPGGEAPIKVTGVYYYPCDFVTVTKKSI